jgi:peptidoglycan/LPS O-acetylase OafA/YrhL
VSEIKPLTSLRGIFALWVVLFHLHAWSENPDNPLIIIDRGYLGVDFFFMLSGFILAARHGEEFTPTYNFNTHVRFLIKRFGRMFPLHWAVLLVVVASCILFREPLYWWTHIASEAALVHRWDLFYVPRAALNGPDWSISTEWAANIAFPVFIWITGFRNRSTLYSSFSTILFLSILIFLILMHGNMDVAEANSLLPLLRCFAEFGLGIILFQRRDLFYQISGDLSALVILTFILAGLWLRYDLLVIFAMITLLPGLALNGQYLATILSTPPLYFLGIISYSIYLIQVPIITAIDKFLMGSPFASVMHWLIIFPIVGFATLTYRFIENPANKLLKSFSANFASRLLEHNRSTAGSNR